MKSVFSFLVITCFAVQGFAQNADTSRFITRINGTDTFIIENLFANADTKDVKFVKAEMKQAVLKTDLNNFLKQNMQKPLDAQQVKGTVRLYLHINENGQLDEEPIVTKFVNPLLDKEAIRLAKALPGWTPGEFDGKVISSTVSLEIPFE